MPRLFRRTHNTYQTWRDGLVLKVMVGRRGVVYRFTPLLLLLCLALLSLGVRGYVQAQIRHEQELKRTIARLEQEKKQVQTFLQRKEREKRQALALAQSRSEELWNELRQRDQQMEQIWKVVGKTPQRQPARTRRSLNASRGGGTHPLLLKRRYLELRQAVAGREHEIAQLRTAAVSYRKEKARQAEMAMWNTIPSLWPCEGYFSSPFGYRIHPVLGYARFHSGCDISAPTGTPIRATAAGRITCADWMGGYGLAITIQHTEALSTLYGHCSSVSVKSGQYVRKGQIVGHVGSTGMSTGPHCHYEVRLHGAQVDPAPYLRSR